jgi:hypothetical protein
MKVKFKINSNMLIPNLHIKVLQQVILLRYNYKTMFHTCVEN